MTAEARVSVDRSMKKFTMLWQKITALALDYSQLLKIRVNALVVASAWYGAHLAAIRSGVPSGMAAIHALAGIGLVAAGTAAMNQVMERDIDARMRRTCKRPVVTGKIGTSQALLLALIMIGGGTVYLMITTNGLTGILTLITSVVYIAIYTPLKVVGPICTTIGALPGAMPPLLGWTAVRGHVGPEAIALFAILFCWQFPHFYSIALLYQEDYAQAGIRMLPVVDPDGRSTALQILMFSFGLIAVSLFPAFLNIAGWWYGTGALLLGCGLLHFGIAVWRSRKTREHPLAKSAARQLLKATVAYLPLLLTLMVLDGRR